MFLDPGSDIRDSEWEKNLDPGLTSPVRNTYVTYAYPNCGRYLLIHKQTQSGLLVKCGHENLCVMKKNYWFEHCRWIFFTKFDKQIDDILSCCLPPYFFVVPYSFCCQLQLVESLLLLGFLELWFLQLLWSFHKLGS